MIAARHQSHRFNRLLNDGDRAVNCSRVRLGAKAKSAVKE